MAELNFNAANVEPDTGVSDPVPAGWYNVCADESDIKPTKDGMGARLQYRFKILDGQFAGRKLFAGFNIRNANPVAQEISFKQLSALAHACGVLNVTQTEVLHNIPIKVRVKIKKATDEYEAGNEITAFKNINEQVGGATAAAAPGAPAPAGVPTPNAPPAPAATGAVPAAGWGAGAGAPAPTQPWTGAAAPAAPTAPPVAPPPPFTPAPPPPAAAAFPPPGWTPHPAAPGHFYMGQEVLTEADLRARYAAPPAPPVAAVPPPPAAPAGPDPAAVAGAATPPWQTPAA
jgi:hypothetical protein